MVLLWHNTDSHFVLHAFYNINHLLGVVGITIKHVGLKTQGLPQGIGKIFIVICQCVYIYIFLKAAFPSQSTFTKQKKKVSQLHIYNFVAFLMKTLVDQFLD